MGRAGIQFLSMVLLGSSTALAQTVRDYEPGLLTEEYLLEFRAREPSALPQILIGGEDKSLAGHVYVVVGRKLRNGLTVYDRFGGFYPPIEGGPAKYFISDGEVRYDENDFKQPTIKFEARITEEQAGKIKYIIKNWDTKKYNIVSQNCVTLIEDVAKAVGLNTAAKSLATITPVGAVKAIKILNTDDTALQHDHVEQKRMERVLEGERKDQSVYRKRREDNLKKPNAGWDPRTGSPSVQGSGSESKIEPPGGPGAPGSGVTSQIPVGSGAGKDRFKAYLCNGDKACPD